jgi:hypothetical protein
MQQFEQTGSGITLFIKCAAHFCGQKDEHRAHLLPFSADNIIRNFIQKRHGRARNVPKSSLKLVEFGVNRCFYFVERAHFWILFLVSLPENGANLRAANQFLRLLLIFSLKTLKWSIG